MIDLCMYVCVMFYYIWYYNKDRDREIERGGNLPPPPSLPPNILSFLLFIYLFVFGGVHIHRILCPHHCFHLHRCPLSCFALPPISSYRPKFPSSLKNIGHNNRHEFCLRNFVSCLVRKLRLRIPTRKFKIF